MDSRNLRPQFTPFIEHSLWFAYPLCVMRADILLHFCQQARRAAIGDWLTRLLPTSCALCAQTSSKLICQQCQQDFCNTDTTRCRQCALPLSSAGLCGSCLRQPPAFDATYTSCDYAAPLDQLVLALKFGAQLGLAAWMAERLRDALLQQQEAQDLPDLICPVPLGQQRLCERGYNQALEIARPLANHLGIALDARLCLRQKETSRQAALPLLARAGNMRQAFAVSPHAAGKIAGLHIGVVDDVMTSGHTLQEIAALLKNFGARRVSNFVFARTPPP